jgi:hypothetical protein
LSRAYWNGFLKLSFVSCPVALYPATTAAVRVSFRQVNRRTGHRLKRQLVDSITGETVETHDKASACGCAVSLGHAMSSTSPHSHRSSRPSTPENGASRRNDYREKSLDRNTTGRSTWNSSSKNFRDTRSSITSRNRMN